MRARGFTMIELLMASAAAGLLALSALAFGARYEAAGQRDHYTLDLVARGRAAS